MPTTTPVPPEEIAAVIINRVSIAPQVLGAQLGNTVRQAFPLVNIKTEYGGLQSFIARYCSGKVFWVGKSGPDDIYTTSPVSAREPAKDNDSTFWQAFANPEKNSVPAINPHDGALATISTGEAPPEGFVEVPKLTEDEHRNFAKEFLLFVNYQDRSVLAPLVARPNFWPEWAERITTQGFGKYKTKWLAFRFHRIFNTLDSRLASLGINEELRAQILERVKETKTPKPQPQRMGGQVSATERASNDQIICGLRELAHRAVDLMGEEELRSLRVPLGVLGDALKPK